MPKTFAVIDCGSNAIRLQVASVDQAGTYRIVEQERRAVRLGHRVFETGKLDKVSRTQARQQYSFRAVQKDLEKKGVHILSAGSDEVPGVYKDIESVMAEQQDLVETIARFDPRIVKMSGDGKAED